MEIIQDLIPAGRPNRPGLAMLPTSITIHDTANANAGADALAHAKYIEGDAVGTTSWHYTVDDHRAVQHLPITETANHSGTVEGNRTSIGIEICENADGDRAQAEANAAELVAMLLTQLGLSITAVKRHYDWNGKHCPHILMDRPGGWERFLAAVQARIGQQTGTPILGPTQATVEQAQTWARARGATDWFIGLAPLYWQEAPKRGTVRPENAYAQAGKETGMGRFGGTIPGPEWHNPCGMKTSSGGANTDPGAHAQFPDDLTGVRAHLDHLALYAGAPGYPRADTPDPRHFASIRGVAPTVEQLGGRWAPAADYGQSIVRDYLAPLLTTPAPTPPAVDPEVEQLRARVKELEGQLAADEVIISDLRGKLDAIRNLVAQWK